MADARDGAGRLPTRTAAGYRPGGDDVRAITTRPARGGRRMTSATASRRAVLVGLHRADAVRGVAVAWGEEAA